MTSAEYEFDYPMPDALPSPPPSVTASSTHESLSQNSHLTHPLPLPLSSSSSVKKSKKPTSAHDDDLSWMIADSASLLMRLDIGGSAALPDASDALIGGLSKSSRKNKKKSRKPEKSSKSGDQLQVAVPLALNPKMLQSLQCSAAYMEEFDKATAKARAYLIKKKGIAGADVAGPPLTVQYDSEEGIYLIHTACKSAGKMLKAYMDDALQGMLSDKPECKRELAPIDNTPKRKLILASAARPLSFSSQSNSNFASSRVKPISMYSSNSVPLLAESPASRRESINSISFRSSTSRPSDRRNSSHSKTVSFMGTSDFAGMSRRASSHNTLITSIMSDSDSDEPIASLRFTNDPNTRQPRRHSEVASSRMTSASFKEARTRRASFPVAPLEDVQFGNPRFSLGFDTPLARSKPAMPSSSFNNQSALGAASHRQFDSPPMTIPSSSMHAYNVPVRRV